MKRSLKDELNERIILAEEYKSQIIGKGLFDEYLDGKYGRDWIEYYDSYVLKCRRELQNVYEHKRQRTKKIFIVFLMSVFILGVLGFIAWNILQGEELLLAPGDEFYVDDLDLVFEQDNDFVWEIENSGTLGFIGLSGSYEGTGKVSVYLVNGEKELLILDSELVSKETITGNVITGFQINENLTINDTGNETELPEDNETIPEVNVTINDTITDEGNETDNESEQGPLEIPEDEDIIEEKPEVRELVEFEEICEETCDLVSLGLNETNYTLRIIFSGKGILNLRSVSYSILSKLLEDVPLPPTEVPVSEETRQYKAIVNSPVRWVKRVDVIGKDPKEVKAELPKNAVNIKVKTGDEATQALENVDKFEEEVENANKIDIVRGVVTGSVVGSLGSERENRFVGIWGRVFGITGKAIDETQLINEDKIVESEKSKVVDLEEIILSGEEVIVVEYETSGPITIEQEIIRGKRVVVTSSDDVEYTEILTYAGLPEKFKVEEEGRIKVWWVEENTFVDSDAYDINENGYLDYVEWITPHLSNQTFEIILITNAEHLDSNRNFISDIFDEVKELDNVWSESILDGEYVRVTFEIPLDNTRDITIFPRVVDGIPIIEVYEINGTDIVAEFEDLQNGTYNKVYLEELSGIQDVFDLKVLDGTIEFDHIIDPPEVLPSFTDISSGSGLNSNPLHSMTIFDCNNDGYLDIAKTGVVITDPVILSVNQLGDGTFVTSTTTLGTGIRGISAGDLDNDGDLDITYRRSNERINNLASDCSDWSVSSSNLDHNDEAKMFSDIDGDGDLDLWDPGGLFMWGENTDGLGNWVGRDAIPDTLASNKDGEGATAADFNNDGFVDFLWTDHATHLSTQAFVNDGDFTYTRYGNVFTVFGLPEDVGEHENMEWAWGDCDIDGDLDVYISGTDSEGLYINDGNGFFTNEGVARGISITDPSGADWGDYNNDGDLDLIVAKNGGVSALYYNDGSCSFIDDAIDAGISGNDALGNVVGWLDFDLDGDLDLMSGEGDLWENDLDNNNYLRVIMEGLGTSSGMSKTPVGAQIDIYDSVGTLVGHREIMAGYNNYQPPHMQHFGLDPLETYKIVTFFPSDGGLKNVNYTACIPSDESITLGTTVLANTVKVIETLDNSETLCTLPVINYNSPPTPDDLAELEISNFIVDVGSSDSDDHYVLTDFNNDMAVFMRMDDVGAGGEVVDLSTQGNDGVLYGDTFIDSNGYWGDAGQFDGAGDFISLSDKDSLDFGKGNFSLSAWIKTTTTTRRTVLAKFGNDNKGYLLDVLADGTVRFLYQENGVSAYRYIDSAAIVNDGNWHHIVGVREDESAQIYVDEAASPNGMIENGNPENVDNDADFVIGYKIGVFTDYFDGTIDEVAVFGRALTSSEVGSLYDAQVTQYSHLYKGLQNAQYVFRATAVDKLGNLDQTESRTVTINVPDLNKPLVDFILPTPPNAAFIIDKFVEVNLSSSDDLAEHYAFTDFNNDLIFWMRMDDKDGSGNPLDKSSKANDGIIFGNGVIINEDQGYWGEGADFAGSNDYIYLVDDSSYLNIYENNMTLSAWVNVPQGVEGVSIMSKQNSVAEGTLGWNVNFDEDFDSPTNPGAPELNTVTVNGGKRRLTSPNVRNDGQWHHVVWVINGKNADDWKLFEDGVQYTPTIFTQGDLSGSIETTEPFYVATRGNGEDYIGKIDEIMIFNRSLGDNAVLSLFNATRDQYYHNFSVNSGGSKYVTGYAVDRGGNYEKTETRVFNLDGWPRLAFIPPTPDDQTVLDETKTEFTVSASSADAETSHYTLTNFNDDILFWYRFENNTGVGETDTYIFDWGGRGNSASCEVATCPSLIGSGGFGAAAKFEDPEHYEIPSLTGSHTWNEFTISAWYKSGAATVLDDEYIFNHFQSEGYDIIFGPTDDGSNDDKLRLLVGTDGTAQFLYGTSDIVDQQWHHIVGIRDDTNLLLYVDGNLEASIPADDAGLDFSITADMFIGNIPGDTEEVNGQIDEIIIFERALSQAEVLSLYDATSNQYSNNFDNLIGGDYIFQAFSVDRVAHLTETEKRTVTISAIPEILDIDDLGNQPVVAGDVSIINFDVAVRDYNGYTDINSVTAKLTSTISPFTTRGPVGCAFSSSVDQNTAIYSCSVDLWYFDNSGNWDVSAEATDSISLVSAPYSESFVVDSLTAFDFTSAISWTGIELGSTNNLADSFMLINNIGNEPLTVDDDILITATDVLGEDDPSFFIPANDFSVANVEACDSGVFLSTSPANVPNALVPTGNNSLNNLDETSGQELLYYCLEQTPASLPNQAYSSTGGNSWELDLLTWILSLIEIVFVVPLSVKRRKKRKKEKVVTEENILDVLDRKLLSEHGVGLKDLLKDYKKTGKIGIPLGIFKNGLSPAEALCKYLKENKGLRFKEISEIIGRDQRTVWINYNNAVKKVKKKILVDIDDFIVDEKIFRDNDMSVLESIVFELKEKGLRISEIAELLGKDQRNIWTVNSRAKKKLSKNRNV